MKKTLCLLFFAVLVVAMLLAIVPINASSAICLSGDGEKKCEGPCCEAGETWCVAEDCPVIQ